MNTEKITWIARYWGAPFEYDGNLQYQKVGKTLFKFLINNPYDIIDFKLRLKDLGEITEEHMEGLINIDGFFSGYELKEDNLNYRGVDYLRRLGYAIGCPKEYYSLNR